MKPWKSGRDQPARRGSWHATTLLLGMAILPTQPDSISVLPPQPRIETIAPLQLFFSLGQTGVSLPANTLLDPNPIAPFDPSMGGLLSGLPSSDATAMGVPNPNPIAPFDPSVGGLLPGLPSSDATAMGVPSDDGAEAQAIDGGSGPALLPVYATAALPAAQNGICAQLTETPAPGSSYWNSEAGSAMPSLLAASNILAAVGPASGMPNQLSAPGSAGVWCRPGPVPIGDSGPASRAFWVPVLILLFGLIVFWITRGFALPR
jgi:hypothetical protein